MIDLENKRVFKYEQRISKQLDKIDNLKQKLLNTELSHNDKHWINFHIGQCYKKINMFNKFIAWGVK